MSGVSIAFIIATIVLAVELTKAHKHHMKHNHHPKDSTANPAVASAAAATVKVTTVPVAAVAAVQGAAKTTGESLTDVFNSYFYPSTASKPVAQLQPYRALGTEPHRPRMGYNADSELPSSRGPQGKDPTPYIYRSQGANSEMTGANRGPVQGANSEMTGTNRGPAQGANSEMTGANRGPAQGANSESIWANRGPMQGANSEDLPSNRLNLGLKAMGVEANSLSDVYGTSFANPGSAAEVPVPAFTGTPSYVSDAESDKQLLSDVYGSAYGGSKSDASADPLRATAANSVAGNK